MLNSIKTNESHFERKIDELMMVLDTLKMLFDGEHETKNSMFKEKVNNGHRFAKVIAKDLFRSFQEVKKEKAILSNHYKDCLFQLHFLLKNWISKTKCGGSQEDCCISLQADLNEKANDIVFLMEHMELLTNGHEENEKIEDEIINLSQFSLQLKNKNQWEEFRLLFSPVNPELNLKIGSAHLEKIISGALGCVAFENCTFRLEIDDQIIGSSRENNGEQGISIRFSDECLRRNPSGKIPQIFWALDFSGDLSSYFYQTSWKQYFEMMLLKYLTELYGGKVYVNCVKKRIVCLQIVLPAPCDVVPNGGT